jgi:hypothetical protein
MLACLLWETVNVWTPGECIMTEGDTGNGDIIIEQEAVM